MIRTRFAPLAALLLAALLLAGCGGGGGGEPTVTQTIHDELQAELDAALAAKRQAEAARAAAETAKAEAETARATADEMRTAAETARAAAESERDTAKAAETAALAAQAEAEAARAEAVADEADARAAQLAAEARLATAQTDLTAAEDKRDEYLEGRTEARTALTMANAEVTRLTGELSKAQAEVTRLTGLLTTANGDVTRLTGELSTANGQVTDLTGELTAARAEVTRLSGVIGDVTDTASAAATASLNAQLKAAKDEVATLTARVGSDTDASSLSGMLATANAEVTRLTGLLTTAQVEVTRLTNRIGTKTDSTSLEGMLEAEKLKVLRLQSQVMTLNERITGLQAQVADAREERDTAQERATQAEREAEQRVTEVRQEAEQQANVSVRATPLLAALAIDANDNMGATVEHMRGKSRVFHPTGNYPRVSSAPGISNWHSASFSRDVTTGTDTGTNTVYLYTNIQSAGSKAFWKVYGKDITEGDANWDVTNAKPSNPPSQGKVKWLNDDGDREDRAEQSLNGSYHGVSGTFTCASGCNLETETGGALVLHGDWTFMPVRGTTNYYKSGVAQDQDTEYLYFGIWASEPTDAEKPHGFKWIASGNTGALTNLNSLTGSATFKGGAVGKYALKKVANREARIGTFTATATFTADFGAVDAPGEISGSITDFREGGTSLTGGWSVTLTETAPTLEAPDDTVTLAAAMDGVATARIGGIGATGAWAASLHGSNNPGFTDIGSGAEQIKCPDTAGCPGVDLAGVAGWFQASDTDNLAAIAGAFGAEYKP